jgi:hypothetical protein
VLLEIGKTRYFVPPPHTHTHNTLNRFCQWWVKLWQVISLLQCSWYTCTYFVQNPPLTSLEAVLACQALCNIRL